MVELYNGDCLEEMKRIPDGSVDMVLCDLPYGTTCCDWDKVIPFEPLWEQYRRVCKRNAAIVLFSQMPFAVDLINSNRKMFRYEWIWEKTKALGFLSVSKAPLRAHENILVFYGKSPTYNPQKWIAPEKSHSRNAEKLCSIYSGGGKNVPFEGSFDRFPRDVIKFSNFSGVVFGKQARNTAKSQHPTQKPAALLEYLIKTYTNPGETVFDNTMGSGSAGVAAVNTGRSFIGIELDAHYFEVARKRIADAKAQARQILFSPGEFG